MSTHPLLYHDTRDDRTEIHRLIDRLTPRQRVAFLEACCRAAVLPRSQIRPTVLPSTYELCRQAEHDDSASGPLTMDVFLSMWVLTTEYQFDLRKALDLLVATARKNPTSLRMIQFHTQG